VVGSVSVSNFPATQPVSVSSGNVNAAVSGSVSVSNFPATQPVSVSSGNSNVIVTSGNITAISTGKTPNGSYTAFNTDVYDNIIVTPSGSSTDAFRRLRVSEPQTLSMYLLNMTRNHC